MDETTQLITDAAGAGAPSAAGARSSASSASWPAPSASSLNRDQFFRSWLIGFLFCLGLPLGSLALLMLQHLSGGQWGMVGRRVFEAASRTLPVVDRCSSSRSLFRLPQLYHWARPEAVASDAILQQKAGYLNVAVLHRPRGDLLRVLDALHRSC